MHHTDAELDRLEDLLSGLPAENEGMLLSEFDGFCAGLLVCPDMILPSEWLPLVWGDEVTASFTSLKEVQSATDLIMGHYNRVARSLTPPSTGYSPVFELDPIKSDTMWELWVTGFETAMALRPECWEAIVESGDEDAAASINLMVAMYQIDTGTSNLEDSAIDALSDQAPELIPGMVNSLNRWTKSRGAARPRPTAANFNASPQARHKPGRNDPCPCGSGRKYKKCCGGS